MKVRNKLALSTLLVILNTQGSYGGGGVTVTSGVIFDERTEFRWNGKSFAPQTRRVLDELKKFPSDFNVQERDYRIGFLKVGKKGTAQEAIAALGEVIKYIVDEGKPIILKKEPTRTCKGHHIKREEFSSSRTSELLEGLKAWARSEPGVDISRVSGRRDGDIPFPFSFLAVFHRYDYEVRYSHHKHKSTVNICDDYTEIPGLRFSLAGFYESLMSIKKEIYDSIPVYFSSPVITSVYATVTPIKEIPKESAPVPLPVAESLDDTEVPADDFDTYDEGKLESHFSKSVISVGKPVTQALCSAVSSSRSGFMAATRSGGASSAMRIPVTKVKKYIPMP